MHVRVVRFTDEAMDSGQTPGTRASIDRCTVAAELDA